MASYNTNICKVCKNPLGNIGETSDDYDYMHKACLKCTNCEKDVFGGRGILIEDNSLFCCELCYTEFNSPQCTHCKFPIAKHQGRFLIEGMTFHEECFRCAKCHRRLAVGDTYGIIDSEIHCKVDYIATKHSDSSPEFYVASQKIPRWERTSISKEQRHMLHAMFQLDPRPSYTKLEGLAITTGLTFKVVKVWFQNMRSRNPPSKNIKNESQI